MAPTSARPPKAERRCEGDARSTLPASAAARRADARPSRLSSNPPRPALVKKDWTTAAWPGAPLATRRITEVRNRTWIASELARTRRSRHHANGKLSPVMVPRFGRRRGRREPCLRRIGSRGLDARRRTRGGGGASTVPCWFPNAAFEEVLVCPDAHMDRGPAVRGSGEQEPLRETRWQNRWCGNDSQRWPLERLRPQPGHRPGARLAVLAHRRLLDRAGERVVVELRGSSRPPGPRGARSGPGPEADPQPWPSAIKNPRFEHPWRASSCSGLEHCRGTVGGTQVIIHEGDRLQSLVDRRAQRIQAGPECGPATSASGQVWSACAISERVSTRRGWCQRVWPTLPIPGRRRPKCMAASTPRTRLRR